MRPYTAGFLIFPGFPMACLTSMIEPLRAANEISGKQAFQWELISESPGKISASALVEFEPTRTLDTLGPLDLMILLSAPTAQFQAAKTPGLLRTLNRHGTVLGAVSGGVFPLMRAGLPSPKPVAVHWCYKSAFDAEFPDQTGSDQVIEISAKLLTAAGAAAAFDLSLHLIEQRLGAGVATEVACWFQHPIMRREGVLQAVPSLSTSTTGQQFPLLVQTAVTIISQKLEDPISIQELASQLAITPRHLERSFKQSTGLNPTHYYRKLRMDAARQMVHYTNEPLSDVSSAVGYSSLQTFGKHYLSAFGVTPKEDRKRINLFRVRGNLPVPSV
jgi:transcriptional regulator GlxA family with amidase domain